MLSRVQSGSRRAAAAKWSGGRCEPAVRTGSQPAAVSQAVVVRIPRLDGTAGGCHATSSEHLYPSGPTLFATGRSSCQQCASWVSATSRCCARPATAGRCRHGGLSSIPKAIVVRSILRKAGCAVDVRAIKGQAELTLETDFFRVGFWSRVSSFSRRIAGRKGFGHCLARRTASCDARKFCATKLPMVLVSLVRQR